MDKGSLCCSGSAAGPRLPPSGPGSRRGGDRTSAPAARRDPGFTWTKLRSVARAVGPLKWLSRPGGRSLRGALMPRRRSPTPSFCGLPSGMEASVVRRTRAGSRHCSRRPSVSNAQSARPGPRRGSGPGRLLDSGKAPPGGRKAGGGGPGCRVSGTEFRRPSRSFHARRSLPTGGSLDGTWRFPSDRSREGGLSFCHVLCC